MNAVARLLDKFRGGGDASVSVPPLDGPLKPNQLLDAGRVLARSFQPDNLADTPRGLLYSSARQLLLLEQAGGGANPAPRVLEEYSAAISALAVDGDAMAVGLASGSVAIRGGTFSGRVFSMASKQPINCPTALVFENSSTLLIANGSARHDPLHWKHDLMEGGSSGTVWRLNLDSGDAEMLATDLAYPYGIIAQPGGSVAISESWRHRILLAEQLGHTRVLLSNLPGYPSRMCPDGTGGYWLALFAPRRRLIELVLREPAYRRRMMQEIASDYWVAPTLTPMTSFLEPLQGGTLKSLARLKPWAPSRSYGLVVQLDSGWQPTASLHSRADGTRHGIRSMAVHGGGLVVASAGADLVLEVPPS